MSDSAQLPTAQQQAKKSWPYVWMLPLIAILICLWLLNSAWQQRGVTITIAMQQGHGLKPGDALRYRGITVGQIEAISLRDDNSGIIVQVNLARHANQLASPGSRFWAVRPELALDTMRGLDTLVGARYLSALPGTAKTLQTDFIGLEQPPVAATMEAGGLEIILTSPGKGNLKPGAPIIYRQVIIGTVTSVDLAKDASAVEASAYIKPAYLNLIRVNCRFWKASGTKVEAGLGGVSVALDSVHSLMFGAINLAIPADPGKLVAKGARFALYDQPKEEWLEWIPGLALQSITQIRPTVIPAQANWQQRSWYYLTENHSRQAWLLPLQQGLLGPADVLQPAVDVLPDSFSLQISNKPLSATPAVLSQNLALIPVTGEFSPWPLNKIRRLEQAEDSLVIAGRDIAARLINAEQWQLDENQTSWTPQPELPLGASWHGAVVVALSDGYVIGILVKQAGHWQLADIDLAILKGDIKKDKNKKDKTDDN